MARETNDKVNLRNAYKKANSTLPKELPFITFAEAERASRLLASATISLSILSKAFTSDL